jgi:hypothetical protein
VSDQLAQIKPASEIASEGLNQFMGDLTPYVMAGVGQLIASLVFVFVGVGGMMVIMFGGIMAGAMVAVALEMEALVGLCSIASYLGAIVVLVMFMSMLAPMQMSLIRAVDKHLDGEGELGIGSIVSTATHRPVGAILLNLIIVTLAVIGVFMCYLPALLVSLLFALATPIYALEDKGVFESLSQSFGHLRANFSWHLPFWGIGLLVAIAGGNIPVLGPMFHVLYLTQGYRAAFRGEGAPA